MVTFHSTYCIDEVENSGLVKGGGGELHLKTFAHAVTVDKFTN